VMGEVWSVKCERVKGWRVKRWKSERMKGAPPELPILTLLYSNWYRYISYYLSFFCKYR
jgi:hypothetical protein